MKTPIAQLIPLIVRGVSPSAAVASGLLSPLAFGASGDVDPAFGDGGTSTLAFSGPAWSLEPLANNESLVAGGELCMEPSYYCDYYHQDGFLGTLSATGALTSQLENGVLATMQVSDIAMQSDGKVVAIGSKVEGCNATTGSTRFRLGRDGALDPTFGAQGILVLNNDGAAGTAVVPADGRIVVAGSRGNQSLVLRLLADSSMDRAFAASEIFLGDAERTPQPDAPCAHEQRRIPRQYQIGVQRVLALNADGVVDESFGRQGFSDLDIQSDAALSCNSMITQSDGSLLLAGRESAHAFAVRLLENGARDPATRSATSRGASTTQRHWR